MNARNLIAQPANIAQFDTDEDPRWLASDARRYTGWLARIEGEDEILVGFEAYVRPDSSDWYDLWHFPTWWEAMAFAMRLAREHGYYFEGRHGHGLA